MIIRIILILAILSAIILFILRRKQIKLGLTPLGKIVIVRVAMQIIRLLVRRIGL